MKIISNRKNWLETKAVDQLKGLKEFEGVIEVVGMPDLHPGYSPQSPIGAVVVTEEVIYPFIIGNDIGCGMSFYMLSEKAHKFKQSKIAERLERYLKEEVSVKEDNNIKIETDLPYKESLGTIGSGNHFAEFQMIEEIVNKDYAKQFNIKKQNIYLLIHSGSRGYGTEVLENAKKTPNLNAGLKEGTKEFEDYMKEHNTAVKWASLNRDLIMENILNNSGIKGLGTKISETNHNIITEEEGHFVHRKGASEAYDKPVIIPGSRDSNSYLVLPTEKCKEIFNSVAHGAGRKWNRKYSKDRLINKYKRTTTMTEKYSSRIVYNDDDLIFQEAPEAYKNIKYVIDSLVEEGYIEVIAILKPVITFKG